MSVNVWAVCVGDKYTREDVLILRNMVASHLNAPHRFRCLSDRHLDGVDCLVPDEIWPGWWSKLLLFRHATGQCLYLDLDVIVVGELDSLVSDCPLRMPKNWAQSGHGGCQSSVMSWNMDYRELPNNFNPALLQTPAAGNCGEYLGHWGDQEYITGHLGSPGGRFIEAMPRVYSYKYHCQGAVPPDAAVICFHGEPKPGQVGDVWARKARSFTQTRH